MVDPLAVVVVPVRVACAEATLEQVQVAVTEVVPDAGVVKVVEATLLHVARCAAPVGGPVE